MDYAQLTAKKHRLDQLRPLAPALVDNLEAWFKVELTYTSNAIEGNTLTRQETALVVEKGLTVGKKTLKEHLEAVNHAAALDWVMRLARGPNHLVENDILAMHRLILKGIDDDNAGRYRSIPVRIAGAEVVLPNACKVPDLMELLAQKLARKAQHPVQHAAEMHYQLVTIHPFVDGNGRTARLLMNLLLIKEGYPPAIIHPRDRLAYIQTLEKAQLGGSQEDFMQLILRSVDRSLDIYLQAARGEQAAPPQPDAQLLKIGALAKAAGISIPTIRHWTALGLLTIAAETASGYLLYAEATTQRIHVIKRLQEQRLTLEEIRAKLSLPAQGS